MNIELVNILKKTAQDLAATEQWKIDHCPDVYKGLNNLWKNGTIKTH